MEFGMSEPLMQKLMSKYWRKTAERLDAMRAEQAMNEPMALDVGSRVRFQPFDGHGPYMNGIVLSSVDVPTGFVHVMGENRRTYCVHGNSLQPSGPETYVTDRHSISSATICPRCLRAHDPKKPLDCECGYTTDKPVSEIWQSGTVGIAHKAGAYFFPEPDAATKEEIKQAVRKMNDRMVMPRSIPDWKLVEYESLELADLRQLRDRLNEIIYDREQGK